MYVLYIGSFSVIGEDQNARAEYVRKQLTDMRDASKSKQVLLVISLSGIKVCSSNGQSVYMAHALKRISYATCDPEFCQFSFLAREPKGHTNVQYCHAFITKTPEEAEELNNIVGNAFKMAYANQRTKQPTFHELIEQQIEAQKQKYQEYQDQKQEVLHQKLKQISTATVHQRAKERRERKERESKIIELEKEMNRVAGKDKVWRPRSTIQVHRSSSLRTEPGLSALYPGAASSLDLVRHPRHSYHGPMTLSPLTWNNEQWQANYQAKQSVIKTKHKSPHLEEVHSRLAASPSSSTMDHNNTNNVMTPSSRLSMQALKDSIDINELRSYGSPVTALKETIDNHYNGQVNCHMTSADIHTDGETYLYPVMSNQDQADGDPNRGTDPRPLPAPPKEPEVQYRIRKSRKSSPQGQKSSEYRSQSPHTYGTRHPTNGHGALSPSQRYQNDSPFQEKHGLIGPVVEVDSGEQLYAGPPTPLRYDSLRKLDPGMLVDEDGTLKQAPWYQAGIPREIALEILNQEDIGCFIVRDSTTHPGCYALSVKVPKFDNPSGISHYLILRTPQGGVKLKGLDKEWPNLTALVTHHTVMPEMLPCPLRLPRTASNPSFRDSDKDEKDEDEDYQKLSDFSTMMADLKM